MRASAASPIRTALALPGDAVHRLQGDVAARRQHDGHARRACANLPAGASARTQFSSPATQGRKRPHAGFGTAVMLRAFLR